MKILAQKNGALSEADRLALAALLLKAGYIVSLRRERPEGNKTAPWVHYVNYEEAS